MKAITLHQPYATLVALKAKPIETRSWPPPKGLIGQRLLIHAAVKPVRERVTIGAFEMWPADDPKGPLHPNHDQPRPPRIYPNDGYWLDGASWVPLQLGAIVASCVLADAVPMVDASGCKDDRAHLCIVNQSMLLHSRLDAPWPDGHTEHVVSDQMPYGDFAPGRWAWLLEDVKPTTERCPVCWGAGSSDDLSQAFYVGSAIEPGSIPPCGYCNGTAGCDPVPAKGKQGLWNWDPAA